ncbi:hypothetical protein [Streptomyces lavendulocolor]|uniref:hypothetical protein n=1 Tax=Streptomyces lavendulocolor TaxID=67316 RepID=UPI003C2CA14A
MTGPLVLIEPYAKRLGGHHQRTLVALAQARPGSLVIAPRGLAREAVAALSEAGARLASAPAGRRAAVLLAAARLAAGLSAAGQRVFRSRRWPRRLRRLPHQITLIARCLTEASALRSTPPARSIFRGHGVSYGTRMARRPHNGLDNKQGPGR